MLKSAHHYSSLPGRSNNVQLIQAEDVKYLGIHLERRLSWHKHNTAKRKRLVRVTLPLTVSQYVSVSSPLCGHLTGYCFLFKSLGLELVVLSLWCALSDERSGLSFVSHSLGICLCVHLLVSLSPKCSGCSDVSQTSQQATNFSHINPYSSQFGLKGYNFGVRSMGFCRLCCRLHEALL
jgi:hypothetical protein